MACGRLSSLIMRCHSLIRGDGVVLMIARLVLLAGLALGIASWVDGVGADEQSTLELRGDYTEAYIATDVSGPWYRVRSNTVRFDMGGRQQGLYCILYKHGDNWYCRSVLVTRGYNVVELKSIRNFGLVRGLVESPLRPDDVSDKLRSDIEYYAVIFSDRYSHERDIEIVRNANKSGKIQFSLVPKHHWMYDGHAAIVIDKSGKTILALDTLPSDTQDAIIRVREAIDELNRAPVSPDIGDVDMSKIILVVAIVLVLYFLLKRSNS